MSTGAGEAAGGAAGTSAGLPLSVSYVLPLRWTGEGRYDADLAELTAYLRDLAGCVDDVVVVDGSPSPLYARHAASWAPYARHLPPDPRLRFANGKVNGITTGIMLARHEAVITADDDVRYDLAGLSRVAALLRSVDLVRPQNYFAPTAGRSGLAWHAQWDTARTLLNRSWTADYPGTFGLRRSVFRDMGGYDGDVLFENLELIRTVRAYGGVEARPRDLYVGRRPPEAARFWDQRRRQAYDDFAQPGRLLAGLAVLPALGWALAGRRHRTVGAAAALIVGLAEIGRRRAGGRAVYPATAPLLSPLWVLERGVCDWLALDLRLRQGGVSYAGRQLRVAGHSVRALRERGTAGTRSAGRLVRPGVGPVRQLLADRAAEAHNGVRAVAEGLEAGRAAPAQRDGAPAGVDLPAVGCGQSEGAADQQRAVLVGRDRRELAVGRWPRRRARQRARVPVVRSHHVLTVPADPGEKR